MQVKSVGASKVKFKKAQSNKVSLGNRAILFCGPYQNFKNDIEDNSIDAAIVDPPYGLAFMGKDWDSFSNSLEKDRKSAGGYGKDSKTNENAYAAAQVRHNIKNIQASRAYQAWIEEWASEVYRVLKPGGYLLAFGGTRTFHRLACGIEYAGFDIRDLLGWCYLSGFPKSHKVQNSQKQELGTALKPAIEPICMARKSFKGSVAKNVQEYGTGAINIGESRIFRDTRNDIPGWHTSGADTSKGFQGTSTFRSRKMAPEEIQKRCGEQGRWPANLIFDEEAGLFMDTTFKDGMSRIFYCPKPSKRERDLGLDLLSEKDTPFFQTGNGKSGKESSISNGRNTTRKNIHPTSKPVTLIKYLIKLVTPPDGLVLDNLMGGGTTGIAALDEGFRFIGIEKEREYFDIAAARIRHSYNGK